jgi:hypothetical protein
MARPLPRAGARVAAAPTYQQSQRVTAPEHLCRIRCASNSAGMRPLSVVSVVRTDLAPAPYPRLTRGARSAPFQSSIA